MISYKPLFKTMIDKNVTLTDLNAILAPNITSKFRKNLHVTTGTLDRLCQFLRCRVEDVIEILPDVPDQD